MTTRAKRKERITKSRKKQILRAALSTFSAKGYGESTMADVARAAGLGVGTLYNYYKSKGDLLISLVQKQMISESLINILDRMPGEGTREFVDSLLEERLNFGFGYAQNILFFFFEIQRDARLRRQYVNQIIAPMISRLEDYLRFQSRSGIFRNMDEKVIARTLIGSVIGIMVFSRLELRESPFKKSDLKKIAHEISGLFLYGLEKK